MYYYNIDICHKIRFYSNKLMIYMNKQKMYRLRVVFNVIKKNIH